MLLRMQSFFVRNVGQKILALLLAVIIWYIAIDKQEISDDSESQVNIPIVYQRLSKDLYIVEGQSQEVTVNYNIRNRQKKINLSEFQVAIDLKTAKVGENFFTIEEEDISKPDGVIINRITPSNIQLNLEEKIQREVTIKPQLNLQLGDKLAISELILNPQSIIINGPKNVIDKLNHIFTEPIDVTGDNKVTLNRIVNLNLPKSITIVDEENNNPDITVRIQLDNVATLKKIEGIAVEIINDRYVTRYNPQEINIVLRGAKEQLQNLNSDNVKALINLDQKTPSRFDVTDDFIIERPFEVEVQKVWPPVNVWILNQDK